MWVQVYLLPYQGARCVLHWAEENSVRRGGRQQIKEWKWEESSVAWPRWLRDNASDLKDLMHPTEVFLYLDEELGVGDRYDTSFLVNLLGHARRATWGANIYLVINKGDAQPELLEKQPVRDEWFESLFAHGLTDICELSGKFSETKLRDAAALSRRRRKILHSASTGQPWLCFIFEPTLYKVDLHKRFLYSFVTGSVTPRGSNCVLVLTRPLSSEHVNFVTTTLKSYPRRKFLVVTLEGEVEEGSEGLYADLQAACRGGRCELVTCRGLFELHFLLQKLNAPREYSQLNWAELLSLPGGADGDGESATPSLLVTHAFVDDADLAYCHAAAAEVSRIRESLPVSPGGRLVLYPVITTEMLPKILELLGAGRGLIWLHIGHGKTAYGILESNSEIFKQPADWLNCFAAYGGRLVLVSFSVCGSAEAASYFAREFEGPGGRRPFAIGFAREVPIQASRFLTEKVIPVAIQSNGSKDAIVVAFEQGSKILEIEYKETFPKLFVP